MTRRPALDRSGFGVVGVQLRWDHDDSLTWSAPLAFGGLAAASLLAIFGMPPVNLHGPLHFIGVMDPLCGMTRGVAASMRGDLLTAWRFNPASPLVPILGLTAIARWAYGRLVGRWLTVRYRRTTISTTMIAVAVVALEINQQMHADLLTQ